MSDRHTQPETNLLRRIKQRFRPFIDRLPAARIAIIYGVVSGLYILFSDRFVTLLTSNPRVLSTLQTYKGLAFIAGSSLLIYVLVLSRTRTIRARQLEADEEARLHNDIAYMGREVLKASSLDEIYRLVLRHVAMTLSIDMVKLAIVEGSPERAAVVEGFGWQGDGLESFEVPTSPEYLAGRVLEARRPIIVERLIEADEFKIPEFLLEQGAVSSMVAPIINEKPLGVLGVHHKRFRRFSRSEANFLQSAANLLGQALLNHRSQEDVRLHSELLDSVGQAVIATDPDGNIFYWNDAAERMYGWPREEAIGSSVVELTPALGQDVRAAEIMQQMQMGQSWEGEFRLRRKDGEEFVALVRNSLLNDEDGEVKAIVGVTTDITNIKDAQRALQKATSRLNLLHQTDQHILSGSKFEKTSQAVLESLSQQIHFGSSLVLEYEMDGNRVRKLASINDPTSFKENSWLPMSFIGMPSQLELPPDPFVYIPDIKQHASTDTVYEEWLEAGQNSLLVARMRVKDKAYGAIVLSRAEVDAFSDEEIDLMISVADSLAVGFRDAQLRQAERKRALELESLQRVTVKLVSEMDSQPLLAGTAEAAFNLLAADNTYLFLYHEAADELEFAAGWNEDGHLQETRYQPRADGITIRVARDGARATFTQVADHELFSHDFPDWVGSLICQPITYRGKVLGVLNLSFNRQQVFSATDLLIVDLLADMAAVAIHNTRQYELMRRKRRESEAMFRVTQRLAGEYQLQDVLESIVVSVVDVIAGAEASSLWLAQPDQEVLRVQAWHGHRGEDMVELAIPRGQSVVGQVIDAGLPISIDDTSQSDLFEPVGEEAIDHIKSLIGVPIWIGQEVIGAIFADSMRQTNAFSQQDFRMLELLGNQAATAIQRARLFDQILESRQRLERVSKDLVRVQEEERSRLARELHDEIGQLLTGLKLTLEMGQDQQATGGTPDLAPAVDIAEQLLDDVRDLSLRLRPSMLDDLGLLPTLMWMVKRVEEQLGLDVEFQHEGIEDQRFPDVIETTAYRVAQESLTNVARHADVSQVRLLVRAEQSELELQVKDDGVGFNPEQIVEFESVRGLSGMRERAILAGGQLEVESAPGEGTKIKLLLPLEGVLNRRDAERPE